MNVIIHAGMNKTATTYLQNNVFPQVEDCLFLPFYNPIKTDFLRHPVKPFDKILISDEALMGVPIFTKYKNRKDERIQIIDNAKLLFPSAKFIVCFRRHSDFVLSLYKQYLHSGGYEKIEKFIDIDNDEGFISVKDLNYFSRIELIENKFSTRPFIYLFEDFKNKRREVIREMLIYIGSSVEIKDSGVEKVDNKGVEYYQGILLRGLNRISKSKLYPEHGLPLYNRYSKKYGIDPRSLCQNRLGNFFAKKMVLPERIKEFLDKELSDDWKSVTEYVKVKQ